MTTGQTEHLTFKICTLIYVVLVLIIVGFTGGYLIYLRLGNNPNVDWYTWLIVFNMGILIFSLVILIFGIWLLSINFYGTPKYNPPETIPYNLSDKRTINDIF